MVIQILALSLASIVACPPTAPNAVPITTAPMSAAALNGGNEWGDSFWDLSPPEPDLVDCPLLPPPVEIDDWAASEIWDDGQAEVATYSATLGREEDFEATMITVKETFDVEEAVKAEPPYEDGEVVDTLKVNWLQRVPFGTTPVQWLTSVFVRRDNPFQLLKATHSSQAWDGNYFRKIRVDQGDVEDQWHSFIDGEAQGERSFSEEPFVTPEQLVVALRAIDPRDGLSFNIRVSRPIRHARYQEFKISGANVRFETDERPPSVVGDPDLDEQHDADSSSCWRVTVSGHDFEWRYWYSNSPERHLLRLEGPGVCLELKNVERRAYWAHPSDP